MVYTSATNVVRFSGIQTNEASSRESGQSGNANSSHCFQFEYLHVLRLKAFLNKTTNIIMVNWSRMIRQSVVAGAIPMLASGPFESHFFSARATVSGN
ncbi:hypothetical protein KIN20_002901 [Parelaphostrongylus tenuis]|uniref:Uncharacterized protein n=1 Tax=Parelaphostrongylus tenuis TaxID=148309 RepID=A0AAD5LZ98_PARTN|nr:hypothetical protein KIN20_002901 [Parelaphostrongylus tenuis]